ncbi:MAG: hypothetical protein JXX28_07940 [Deltaproteobacteria bacterium]|nr:hypothetical protein [Deltaproteobacteria bacterium]
MLSALIALATLAHAQSASEAWRLLETEHFRVQYPLAAEAWTLGAVSELESIHGAVEREVGWSIDRRVEVLVQDPWSMANGMALPSRFSPAIVLWATAPEAGSSIGDFRSWREGLITHEDTHIVHMLRPSRNPWLRGAQDHLLGVGPVAIKSPIWLVEGYAVHMEGRLTGTGRPHADDRAALLRQWAQEGLLPGYEELVFGGGWQGRAVPYMVGSAYVDWLAEGWGEQSLRDLWSRMTARTERDLDEAFQGVYGDSPAALYRRFTAELTLAAMDIERSRPPAEGALWLQHLEALGAPALSPDGARLALVVTGPWGTDRLEVYPTAPSDEAREAWMAEREALLEKDPLDVPAVEPAVWSPEPERVRHTTTRSPVDPRWLPDGERLIYAAWTRRPGGGQGPDLWIWDLEGGGERRLTRGAGLRSPDPHPTQGWAVAVQQAWGQSGLVRVDLDTGAVRPLVEAREGVLVDHPRVSPDGTRLLWLEHRDAWRVVTSDLQGDGRVELPLPDGATGRSPAWSPDSASIFVAVGRGGFMEVERIGLGPAIPVRLTQSAGAAWAPAPTPDGQGLFYLSSGVGGVDLRRMDLSEARTPRALDYTPRAPAVRQDPISPPAPAAVALDPGRPYGVGRQGLRLLTGGVTGPGTDTLEVGVSMGDLVGRSSLLALGSFGSGSTGVTGLGGAWTWRGLPVEVETRGFALRGAYGDRMGGSAALSHTLRGARGVLDLRLGGWGDAALDGGGAPARAQVYGESVLFTHRGLDEAVGALELRLRGGLGDERFAEAGAQLLSEYQGMGLDLSVSSLIGDGVSLVGVRSSVAPDPWGWRRRWVPALGGAGLGAQAVHSGTLAVSPLGEGLDLFAEHHQLSQGYLLLADDGHARIGDGLQLAGLRLHGEMAGMPLVRTPGLWIEVGAASVLLDPEGGRGKLNDPDTWRGWVGVGWRP